MRSFSEFDEGSGTMVCALAARPVRALTFASCDYVAATAV
jgi:hypothetical protein